MVCYQFQFSKNAEDAFSKMHRVLQCRILKKLLFWEKSGDPLCFSKKLMARENTYRFRVGDYRILVVPKSTRIFIVLVIVKIGHRRDVYEE